MQQLHKRTDGLWRTDRSTLVVFTLGDGFRDFFKKRVNNFKIHVIVLKLPVTKHCVRKSTLSNIPKLYSWLGIVGGFYRKIFSKTIFNCRDTELLLTMP